MRWFRDGAKLNSWFALFALAMNFVLSFGHVHLFGSNASERDSILQVLTLADHGKAQENSNDFYPDDLCPICVATAVLANALVATPPPILLQFDGTVVDRTAAFIRLVATLYRVPFQSRGPPIS